MVAGEVVFSDAGFTRIAEREVRETVAETALRLMGSDQDPEAVGLGWEVDPYVLDFYRSWARTPLEPAAVYNAASPPASAD